VLCLPLIFFYLIHDGKRSAMNPPTSAYSESSTASEAPSEHVCQDQRRRPHECWTATRQLAVPSLELHISTDESSLMPIAGAGTMVWISIIWEKVGCWECLRIYMLPFIQVPCVPRWDWLGTRGELYSFFEMNCILFVEKKLYLVFGKSHVLDTSDNSNWALSCDLDVTKPSACSASCWCSLYRLYCADFFPS